MGPFTLLDIVKIGITVVSSGAFTLLITWLINRKKSNAETSKLKAETVLTFADGWENLAKEYKDGQDRATSMVKTLTAQVKDLTDLIETERKERVIEKEAESKARQAALAQKDAEILRITGRVRTLEDILKKNGIATPEELEPEVIPPQL